MEEAKTMQATSINNPAARISAMIQEFTSSSPENRLGLRDGEKAFDRPLVGFASGADPLFAEYVNHIGDFYLTPLAVFRQAFPQATQVHARELTVISWILPSTSATRQEQAARRKLPSQRWARTRLLGEQFNETLRRHVVQTLAAQGIASVAPMLAPFWSRSDQGPYAPCSNWSERHAAYAAGLGTFGLCDGLITPLGKAMRTGSVVVRLEVPPTTRPYKDRHAYCLHYSHGTCGKCIRRCPVQALSATGHDKKRCMQYTEHSMHAYMTRHYHLDTYACGLCQVAVPCMDHIPSPEEG